MLLLATLRPVGTGLSTVHRFGIISINTANNNWLSYRTVVPTGDRAVEAPAVQQAHVLEENKHVLHIFPNDHKYPHR